MALTEWLSDSRAAVERYGLRRGIRRSWVDLVVGGARRSRAVDRLLGLYVAARVATNTNDLVVSAGGETVAVSYDAATYRTVHSLLDRDERTVESIPLDALAVDAGFDAVVDVGAHFGVYSVLLAKFHPGADLYCFEPDEHNRDVLTAFLDRNGVSGAVREEVVTDADGSVDFYVDPEPGSERHSTAPREEFEAEARPSVALSTLFADSDVERAFVKVDAEGEECRIVEDLATADVDRVEGIVELHPDKMDRSRAEAVEFLEDRCSVCALVAETAPAYRHDRPVYSFVIDRGETA